MTHNFDVLIVKQDGVDYLKIGLARLKQSNLFLISIGIGRFVKIFFRKMIPFFFCFEAVT